MTTSRLSKLKVLFLSVALIISILLTGCTEVEQNTNLSGNSTSEANIELPKDALEATIDRVVDGDTMKIKLKDSKETITLRLLLVDTPESVKQGVDPQPYSKEASDFAKSTLTSGDKVYIEYDEGDKTDKYDRHLGYLWYYNKNTKNYEIFNETLISNGYARVGYVYSQTRHLDRFNIAQEKAKESKLNIWSVPGYVTNKGYDVDAYKSNKNSSTSSNSSRVVYANGGSSSSSKYHSSSDAHGMKGSIKMTEEKAKASGYVPCGTCY